MKNLLKRKGGQGTAACSLATSLVLAAAVVLTGCSGDSGQVSGGQTLPTDRSIRIAVTSAPRSLDPVQLDAGQQAYVWASLYDSLLYIDNHGKLQPNAAESWEYSEDGRTLTLKLRPKMTFSTGDPVNATAVKKTMERNKTTPGQQQDKMLGVESIEAPDDLTVRIKFSAPDAAFLYNMAMDAGVIADPATLTTDRTSTDPVGSGPYVLDKNKTVQGSTYVLNRREDHWNVAAYPFKTVTVRVLADQTSALNALRAGELDVSGVPANQLETVTAAGNFNVTHNPTNSIGFINLADRNGTVLKPLGDVRVRRAINYAFDRQRFVDKLLHGAGTATVQQFNLNGAAYDPKLEEKYPFDVNRGKELLKEAGYPNGFDVSMPSTPLSQSYEPSITQALGDIGIKVNWDPVPPQNSTAAVVSGKYPMYFFISSATVAQREVPRQLGSATMNPFKWSSPELGKLLSQANEELDQDKQAEIYKEINRYVVENALFAPLSFIGSNTVTSADIKYLATGANNFPTIRLFGVAE